VRSFLFDADAFRCLHGLKLLDPVLEALRPHGANVLTEYVACHELNLLAGVVDLHAKAGALLIERVVKGTPAGVRYRELQRIADKGEAEAIAWALEASSSTLFVTRDKGARVLAIARRICVTDVMGIVVEACELAGMDRELAKTCLAVWDDPGQQLCRPNPYPGFDRTYAERTHQRTWA